MIWYDLYDILPGLFCLAGLHLLLCNTCSFKQTEELSPVRKKGDIIKKRRIKQVIDSP